MALETRYEVSTQVLSSIPAERLPAMCGRATLAMLVSSTSMKVESMTVKAIHQGLMAGRQPSCMASSAWARSLICKALRLRAQEGEGGRSPRSAERQQERVWKRTNARGKVTQTVYGSLEKRGVAQVTNAEKPLNYEELGRNGERDGRRFPKRAFAQGMLRLWITVQ